LELGKFFLSEFSKKLRDGGVLEHAINEVGQSFYIPEVNFEGVAEDFGYAGLFRDDDGDASPQSLQGRNPKRLRNRRHHIDIAQVKETFYFGGGQKARKAKSAP
jgi:hypothetical protein